MNAEEAERFTLLAELLAQGYADEAQEHEDEDLKMTEAERLVDFTLYILSKVKK